MYFKLYMPAGIWGFIWVALLILAAHAGLYLFDNWRRQKKLPESNEVAGIIFNVLSLIYSLLVAFVIVAVWENYEELNRTIEKETDNINSVLVNGNMMPAKVDVIVSAAIKTYCETVVTVEWDMLEYDERLQQSSIPDLRLQLYQLEAGSKIEESLLSIMDVHLNNISNFRRERLSHTRSYVPELVWMILIISSVMVILFSYFLYLESIPLKRVFLTFLWCIIGMSLFLVYMLDHPFAGSTQVSKAPYESIIHQLNGKSPR